MLRGLKRSEIAAELHIQPGTVDDHRDALYARLGIHSRAELFRLAERGSTGTPPPESELASASGPGHRA